jgi:hypothetical protein
VSANVRCIEPVDYVWVPGDQIIREACEWEGERRGYLYDPCPDCGGEVALIPVRQPIDESEAVAP